MPDQRDEEKSGKSIGERVEEFFKEILETLEGLAAPPPALVPVPVRPTRRPVRRR